MVINEVIQEHIREYQKKYRKDPQHHKKHILAHRAYKARLKKEIIAHYSPTLTCQRCGFSDIRALTIDHINGKGFEHRKKIGKWGGHEFYQWLKRNDFPTGYQVLCMNCQWIKRFENSEWAWERMKI